MIGVDIVHITRIKLDESFVTFILSKLELEEFNSIKLEKRKKEYLAGRFASKEAIFKATQDPEYLKYSILYKENGQPYVVGHPEINISISHDGEYAIAFVIA